MSLLKALLKERLSEWRMAHASLIPDCPPAAVIDGSLIISLISEPNYPTRLRVSRRYRPLDQQRDGQREGGQSLKHN